MSGLQRAFDGTETPHPVRPPRFTPRQRELVRMLRALGVLRAVEAGRIMHVGPNGEACHRRRGPSAAMTRWKGTARAVGCCPYASTDGHEAMKRLVSRGVAEKSGRGLYRLVNHPEDWT